jgi:methyl-accepting chemotaxis protein
VSPRVFGHGAAFRGAIRTVSATLQTATAGLVALYLTAILRLDAWHWREFWIAIAVVAGAYMLLNELVQRRIEGPVVRRLEAVRSGSARPEDLPAAFEALMDLPLRMFLLSVLSWNLGGILIPLWMHLRLGDLSAFSGFAIWVAAITGGFVSCIFGFFALKRLTEPLRDAWATELGNPELRDSLVRRLPLAAKLGLATCAVVGVSVLFAVLLAYAQAARPVELHATQLQQRYLARLAPEIAGPGDPALEHARGEVRALGVAAELLVFDSSAGRVLDGPADLLSPGEGRQLAHPAAALGDSHALDSPNVFSWARLERAPGLLLVAVTPKHELTADLLHVGGTLALLLAVALGIAGVSAFLLAGDVSRATRRLGEQAERIARGDLRVQTVLESEDELGALARSFERMTRVLRDTVARVGETADRVDEAASAIAASSASVASATSDQVQGVEQATTSMASIDRQVAGITESAQVLNGNVEEASSSILELGAAGDELNQTASALSGQIDDVSGSIEQMIRSVRQIGEHTEGLAQEVSETSASISEMARSMNEVDAHALETARLSSRVVELAETGRERVQQTIGGMDEIRETTDTVAAVIQSLGLRVNEIGAIVDVIDDVADETNLLALNAAIIAAQAGEQGRAFSVVADEIKDLADRVLSSTKEIGALIRSVQQESGNAISAIERGTESVQAGVDLSAEAGLSLEEITAAARASGERIKEIVSAVREQAKASSHAAGLMERVSRRVQEIRVAGREQERGNEVVMRGSLVMREVAQQTHRTTEEQSRGARLIRESVESVRDAVDRIHGGLQEQSQACRRAVSFLEKISARTRSNGEAATRTTEATRALKQEAEKLRDDVRRFRI